MKISKLIIALFAISIMLASCSSNDEDNDIKNPDTSIPEKDYLVLKKLESYRTRVLF